MAIQWDLGNGQSLYLENQNEKTLITLARDSRGQQQQSSSSFTTGSWQTLPQIYRVNGDIRIKITTEIQEYIFAIVNNGITLITDEKSVQTLPIEQGQEMPKMPPMKMGNMSMDMSSMSMTMGNMSMSMGNKHCTQCGAKVSLDAKFCSECGNKLQ
jgi:hypothetical protein